MSGQDVPLDMKLSKTSVEIPESNINEEESGVVSSRLYRRKALDPNDGDDATKDWPSSVRLEHGAAVEKTVDVVQPSSIEGSSKSRKTPDGGATQITFGAAQSSDVEASTKSAANTGIKLGDTRSRSASKPSIIEVPIPMDNFGSDATTDLVLCNTNIDRHGGSPNLWVQVYSFLLHAQGVMSSMRNKMWSGPGFYVLILLFLSIIGDIFLFTFCAIPAINWPFYLGGLPCPHTRPLCVTTLCTVPYVRSTILCNSHISIQAPDSFATYLHDYWTSFIEEAEKATRRKSAQQKAENDLMRLHQVRKSYGKARDPKKADPISLKDHLVSSVDSTIVLLQDGFWFVDTLWTLIDHIHSWNRLKVWIQRAEHLPNDIKSDLQTAIYAFQKDYKLLYGNLSGIISDLSMLQSTTQVSLQIMIEHIEKALHVYNEAISSQAQAHAQGPVTTLIIEPGRSAVAALKGSVLLEAEKRVQWSKRDIRKLWRRCQAALDLIIGLRNHLERLLTLKITGFDTVNSGGHRDEEHEELVNRLLQALNVQQPRFRETAIFALKTRKVLIQFGGFLDDSTAMLEDVKKLVGSLGDDADRFLEQLTTEGGSVVEDMRDADDAVFILRKLKLSKESLDQEAAEWNMRRHNPQLRGAIFEEFGTG